jgi:LytTr DNA-binding domain
VSSAQSASFRLPATARIAIPLAWTAAMLVVIGQNTVLGWLGRAPIAPGNVLRSHGPFALAWAVATPFILRSARRWRIEGNAWWRNLLVHALLAAVFVIATNAIVRVPLLVAPAVWARSLAAGVVTFGPWAVLAYAVIVAVGHAGAFVPPAPASVGNGLVARTGNRVTVIPPAEIDWIDAASNYVRVRTGQRTWLLRQPLGEIEERLPDADFVRIHRSTIVALRAIREVRPRTHGDAMVILRDGTSFRVPRTRRQALAAAIDAAAGN